MELAFLTPLLKNGAESIGRGIAINNKRFLETRLAENGGGTHRINESIKRSFVFVVPVEFAPFRTVGNECIKRGGQHAKVANVHLVKVEKT